VDGRQPKVLQELLAMASGRGELTTLHNHGKTLFVKKKKNTKLTYRKADSGNTARKAYCGFSHLNLPNIPEQLMGALVGWK
jgi:hypothetical protein